MNQKCFLLFVFCSFYTAILIGQKTENVLLVVNDELQLSFEHHVDADISKKDWIKFKLRNKTTKSLFFKSINYSINTFEINDNGERELKQGALGRSKMYNLLSYYHDLKKIKPQDKFYELPAKKEITFWKYPSNTASAILENSIGKSQEICGLMEVRIEYGHGKDPNLVDSYSGEEAFCFDWTTGSEINSKLIAEHIKIKIDDIKERKINSAILNTLVLNEAAIQELTIDTIVYGIEKRGYTQNKSERLALLKALDKLNGFENEKLLNHYQTCMQDRNCDWIEDLKFYWHKNLFDTLIANNLFINEKIKILEIHSESWRKDIALKNKLHAHVKSKVPFDYNYIPSQEDFFKWYKKIKILSTTRHPDIISYLSGLLDNETFLKIEDWSGQRNKRITTNKDKAKIIKIRICDVAYVGLLRALNKVKVNKTFEGFKYSQKVFINEKWRGSQEGNSDGLRLKNAYSQLALNLNMAEKYYFLNDQNKLEIRKSLRRLGY